MSTKDNNPPPIKRSHKGNYTFLKEATARMGDDAIKIAILLEYMRINHICQTTPSTEIDDEYIGQLQIIHGKIMELGGLEECARTFIRYFGRKRKT